MAGLRTLARPLLASIFVVQGLQSAREPGRVAPAAEPVVKQLSGLVPAVPAETEQAVRLNGTVQVAAGATLGLGLFPRLSALALAASLVPTTLAGHRFWEYEDPQQRAQQRIHFLKNLTMLGGLLIAVADSGGRRRRAAKK
jgi:putative oxidoreductase